MVADGLKPIRHQDICTHHVDLWCWISGQFGIPSIMSATKCNIDSGNGLLPEGTKPLLEPMITT